MAPRYTWWKGLLLERQLAWNLTMGGPTNFWENISALEDHEKSDLDPDQDHLPKSDLRSRSDPDLT